ncbi:hypothetical protein AAMO2058_001214500 [Amorphochlora amoebiformis]
MKASYDFLVVGAGFSGMNAVAALLRSAPRGRILVVDQRTVVGGSWNDFYPFAKLHLPHLTWGVNAHTWHLEDPNILASRDDVLKHFRSYAQTLDPARVHFLGGSRFVTNTPDDDAHTFTNNVTLTNRHQSQFQVSAGLVLNCVGFDYKGHNTAEVDPHSDGSTANRECQPKDLPKILQQPFNSNSKRMFVVIGGGKTATDAASYILSHIQGNHANAKDAQVLIITGRSKYFFNRDMFAPKRPVSSDKTSLSEYYLDMILQYDGTNSSSIMSDMARKGLFLKLGDEPPESTYGGFLSPSEILTLKQNASIIENDYFQGLDTPSDDKNSSYTISPTSSSLPTTSSRTSRIRLASGRIIETDAHVILVNCRSCHTDNYQQPFLNPMHPLRPDNTLLPGAILGSTGGTSYLLTSLAARAPHVFDNITLYANNKTRWSHYRTS